METAEELLLLASNTIRVMKLSMLVHPDCTEGSEFDDYTSSAQEVEDKLNDFLTRLRKVDAG